MRILHERAFEHRTTKSARVFNSERFAWRNFIPLNVWWRFRREIARWWRRWRALVPEQLRVL